MTLRDQLDGKAPRRAVVPIPISDPGEAARRAADEAATLYRLHEIGGMADAVKLDELKAKADAAAAVVAEHMVDVELQSMRQADWEALCAEYTLPSGDDMDWRAMLPIALAASCVDESLEDPEWWASKFDDPGWTAGEITALRRAIVQLNQWSPSARLPKG